MTTMWVVGLVTCRIAQDWRIVAIVDDEQQAISLCATEYYFVAPCPLNERLSVVDRIHPLCSEAAYPLYREARA
jgi:hypothetical protein